MPRIYIESDIKTHPKTKQFLKKFKNPHIIEIEKYAEVFNRKNQNFRLQKNSDPAYILAKKRENFVLPVPECNSLQTPKNFYFSHLYNCPFDCEYCYLQGMYFSAYFVFFVNFEDFAEEIKTTIKNCGNQKSTFFSGYDADSLALDGLTKFADFFIPFFETQKNTQMELRTKSGNIKALEQFTAPKNSFITFTLSPEKVTRTWEKKTAPLSKRLESIKKLLDKNWRVKIRFEPLIHFEGWEKGYQNLFEQMQEKIPYEKIESLAFGHLRFPKEILKKMQKDLPESQILAKNFVKRPTGEYTYSKQKEEEMTSFLYQELKKIYPEEKLSWYESCG